jgi:NAD(P)-dependent dehydrogenase (short-subunit alcohol dehydrogenase family)
LHDENGSTKRSERSSMTDPFERFRLDGKVGIVTGGAGLLGQEFCKTLAAAGGSVVLADLDQEKGEVLASSLADDGNDVKYFPLDVTNPSSSAEMISWVKESWGRIDILVNSAALDPKFDPEHAEEQTNRFEEYPLGSWKQALDVNLTGMFLVTQSIANFMATVGKGSIINICSTYGLVGPDQRIYQKPGEMDRYKPVYYSVTKAGVLGFTRYLAAYYRGTQIRVNALTPGGVYNDHDDAFIEAYSARTILGRMARKDEMNGALLFLASEASSYMTGANLVVDGGWTAW